MDLILQLYLLSVCGFIYTFTHFDFSHRAVCMNINTYASLYSESACAGDYFTPDE